MDEKLYKKIKSIGAGNIVFGIISVVCGVTTGVLLSSLSVVCVKNEKDIEMADFYCVYCCTGIFYVLCGNSRKDGCITHVPV